MKPEHLPEICMVGHVSIDEVVAADGIADVHVGGAAYAAAVGSSLLTRSVGLVSRVGADFPLHTKLEEYIDYWAVKREEGNSSRFKLDYREPDITRGLRAQFGVGTGIRALDVPPEWLQSAWFHVATMPPEQQLEVIEGLRLAHVRGISVDTVEMFVVDRPEICVQVVGEADLSFVNDLELSVLQRAGYVPPAFLAVKHGELGASLFHRDQLVSTCPAIPTTPVDPTNAGDVFAGAFLAGWVSPDASPSAALASAVQAATQCVQVRFPDALLGQYGRPSGTL